MTMQGQGSACQCESPWTVSSKRRIQIVVPAAAVISASIRSFTKDVYLAARDALLFSGDGYGAASALIPTGDISCHSHDL